MFPRLENRCASLRDERGPRPNRSLPLAALIRAPGASPVTRRVRRLAPAAPKSFVPLRIRACVFVFCVSVFCVSAFAQSGGGYLIKKSTIDSGGYTYHTGGGYKLGGTVGQHDAGPLSGGGYLLTGGFWSPAVSSGAPSAPTSDPSGLNKTRFISFSVAGGASTALRVRFVSLHHVSPGYTGGTSAPFTLFEGQTQYVGPPALYRESGSSPPSTDFYASQLQCAPNYQNWSTVGLLHVSGEAIVPSSTYNVENLAASCAGNESICTAVSAALAISTTRWADVETPYQDPLAAPSQPAFGDISALKNKFASALGAAIKARTLLSGDIGNRGLIDISPDVNFSDISLCVDAFQGKPYPYKPGKCTGDPAKACITDSDCTAQGTTGPCILCP